MLIKKPIWLNSTPEHKSILITLLLLANHDFAEWEWMGKKFKICPGQLVTSLESIRKKTGRGISIQNVRSCLKRLQKLDFVTDKATKAGRLITIINWDSYQPKNKKSTKIPTKEQQRSNKGATPNKNERTTRMKEEQLLGEFKTPSFIPENYQFQKNHLEYSLSKKLSKEQAEDQFEAFIIHAFFAIHRYFLLFVSLTHLLRAGLE